MKQLETIQEFQDLRDTTPIVAMFSAGWCPDCRVIEPVLPEIEADFPNYTFIEINRDNFIDLCQEYDVFGIPSFIVFRDGQEVGRLVSKERKTKEEIVNFLKGLQSS